MHVAVRGLARTACAFTLVLTTASHAQSPGQLAARRDLLDRAQQADTAGNHAQALDLARRAGTLLMSPSLRGFIARQETQLGQLVAAMGDADACVREAEHDAAIANRDAIIADCRGQMVLLRTRVGRVIVHVPSPAPEGLRVTVAGDVLDPALYDVGTVVTPGTVHVEATASGMRPFARDVTVTAASDADVRLAFEASSAPQPIARDTMMRPTPTATASHAIAPPQPLPPSVAPHPIGTLGAIGIGAAAVGVVALGIGTFLYVDTGGTYDQCMRQGGCLASMEPRATEAAGVVLMWAGGAVALAGAVAFVIDRVARPARNEHVRTVWIDPRGAVGIGGRF
jgi:hypothetical protein